MRVSTAPVDGWSAYYALLTEALSASPRPNAARNADARPAVRRRSLAERIDHWFAERRIAEQERYLAQSADLCELERRQRDVNLWRYY